MIRARLSAVVLFALLFPVAAGAQRRLEPGHPIGKVSVRDKLIVLELDEGVLGKANMFDLVGRTLRFSPEARSGHNTSLQGGLRYRVENVPLQWDAELGEQIKSSDVTLKQFKFPFSGKTWDALSIGGNGSIRFGGAASDAGAGLGAGDRVRGDLGGRLGGVQVGRFDQLAEAAGTIVNTVPAICVFMKPRLFGNRYVKELPDSVVITWDVTEPWGNIQDFTWTKTKNIFQAVLHRDGAVEMSYQELHAQDAVVGLYPLISASEEKPLARLPGASRTAAPAHLDIRNVKLSVVDEIFLRVTIETRGPVLQEGDAALPGDRYRIYFDTQKPAVAAGSSAAQQTDAAPPSDSTRRHTAVWTIRGLDPQDDNGGRSRYIATGPGVSRKVTLRGNTISVQGVLPPALRGTQLLTVSAEAFGSDPNHAANSNGTVSHVAPQLLKLTGIRSPEVDLSSLTRRDGPFSIVFESFYYLELPNPRDMTCSVIKALGDKFDFLAYYSDFRVDNQEAGTPSTGPLGSTGPAVTGIGASQHGVETYCSQGRFQWQFVQPVYVGSNQMQEYPPADAPVGTDHDVTYYQRQLGERTLDGKMLPYNYAMSQIGHEMGHRWGAFVSAKVGNETISLGPTHWARGVHAPVAFPYQRPTEASAMGGSVWQENFDGTFTQLDDDYYVPATGWSYLDLYLMGMASPAEVPDFFILRNLAPAGRDPNGHPVFKADRTKVTVKDVIAVEGERQPDVYHSQRDFNTGIVVVVEHGKQPSLELLERAEGIRQRWMDYWSVTTGRRSTMTTDPE